MKTNELCITALLGCILFLSFSLCSQVLDLEVITLMVVLISLYFRKNLVLLSILVFSFCLVLSIGFNIHTCMYLVVYVVYGYITVKLKKYLLKHSYFRYGYIGGLSFLTGQILQLPFMLVSSKVTMIYILLGLKTSLIQGGVSFVAAMLLFDVIHERLNKILKGKYQ